MTTDQNDYDPWAIIDCPAPYTAAELIADLPLRGRRVFVVFHFGGYRHIIRLGKAQARDMLSDRQDDSALVWAALDDDRGDIYLFDERGL